MPEIRVLTAEADLALASQVFRTAMVGMATPRSEDAQASREPGRTIGAYLEGELVGVADASSSGMVLPGGARVPHAAVTHVGVLPTHTRRGVMTALMRRQLHDARDRGEVVASLRASEAAIYGRFGYGMASSLQTVELNPRRAVLREGLGAVAPVRLLDAGTAWETVARIASRHPSTRAGTIDRHELWWASQRSHWADSGPRYVAVCGDPGAETGFARYHPVDTARWFTSGNRTVVVNDLHAPTAQARMALVRFLLSLDLVDTVVFNALPLDDPMPWLLTDYRAARVRSISDETWLRLLDVSAALAARTFFGAAAVTVEVRDALLPENAGTYAISVDGVARVEGPGELAADVSTLAAVFLGGAGWGQLAAAGLVDVREGSALARAESLFAVGEAPFAGMSF